MNESIFQNLRDHTEPAHPGVVRLYDELIQIYRQMREQQKEIDAAFDRVASQIGFVVTTTLPVRIEIGEDAAVKGAELDGASLRGTLFERELGPFVARLKDRKFSGVPAGTFRFYLIWYDALRLKLSRDWMEPAHVLQGLLSAFLAQPVRTAAVRPEVREPAHWFDPGVAIAIEDAIVISAIDEVYPELRLSERIAADRLAIRRVGPGVREPAHPPFEERDLLAIRGVGPGIREPAHPPYEERDLLAIRGVGPGVREPAHPPYQERDLFAELRAAIAKLRKS